MHICHINLASGFSGGERQTLTLIQHQLKHGATLTVVAKDGSPFAKAIAELPCRLITTSHFLFKHAKALTRDCDAMHVHEGRAVYWALIQHLRTGIPYLITRRIDNPLKNKLLLKLAYQRAQVRVGLSSAIVGEIQKRLPDCAVERIPSSPVAYPVNETKAADIRKRYAGKLLVIQAAKMHAHKGYDQTIAAARQLEKVYPQLQFCLLGDGPEKQALEEQAQGLSNLSFEGQQSNMGDWFAAADVLIHPAYSEGLGSVLLEASLAGLPIIAARAGGIPDIIRHEDNGLLIAPGQTGALVNALQALTDNPALRSRLGTAAQARVKDFAIEKCAERYAELYTRMANARA